MRVSCCTRSNEKSDRRRCAAKRLRKLLVDSRRMHGFLLRRDNNALWNELSMHAPLWPTHFLYAFVGLNRKCIVKYREIFSRCVWCATWVYDLCFWNSPAYFNGIFELCSLKLWKHAAIFISEEFLIHRNKSYHQNLIWFAVNKTRTFMYSWFILSWCQLSPC